MFRLRKSTKIVIIILLIAAAGYFSVRISNIETIFSSGITKIKIDDRQADNIFQKLDNDRKIKLLYSTSDLTGFTSALNNIYAENNISPHYSNNTANYYVSIFDYPKTITDSIMTRLRNLQNLNNEFLESADPDKFEINIDDHIANKERVKRTLEKKIDNAIIMSDERIDHYNQQLTNIQMQIDSLRNKKNIIADLSSKNLVYLQVKNTPASGEYVLRTRRLKLIRNFLLYFVAFLFISVILLIAVNYFLILLLKLMQLLGIKTARSSSGGYSYGSNSYRSKYSYSKPKKVKRIYKDSEGNIIKQKVSKE